MHDGTTKTDGLPSKQDTSGAFTLQSLLHGLGWDKPSVSLCLPLPILQAFLSSSMLQLLEACHEAPHFSYLGHSIVYFQGLW